MKGLNYLMGHILYQIFKITLKETVTDNLPIMIYVNKIENRITFKIKTRCYLELLMPETMKLLGSTKSKISKDKNGESVPHLEVISGNCNINNNNQHDS